MKVNPSTSRVTDHELQPYFDELAAFDSTVECEQSEVYRQLRSEIDRVLGAVEHVEGTAPAGAPDRLIRAVAWNIERGMQLDGIIPVLESHPALAGADLLFLTEVDYGMARAGNRHVAREIGEALGLHYAFAPCYLALTKGAGVEADASGENTMALHGNALMSRYPLGNVHALALPNGKDKMRGREKRLGSQRAIIADVEHPAGTFRAAVLHMDAHSSQAFRQHQMTLLLDHLDSLEGELPVLIGGDWNTTTHNASRALYSILGYVLRVVTGVRQALVRHYPYPDRWYERRLFQSLESRGYDYRTLNVLGGCTLHYSITDLAANKNMGEWIPGWCFWFINWALEPQGGRCSLKLDWFAGRGVRVDPNDSEQGPAVIADVSGTEKRLSDHDPITLGFTLDQA